MRDLDYIKDLESEGEGEKEEEKEKEEDLMEHYKKLVQYKNNLLKLEALIQLEKDEESRSEFI